VAILLHFEASLPHFPRETNRFASHLYLHQFFLIRLMAGFFLIIFFIYPVKSRFAGISLLAKLFNWVNLTRFRKKARVRSSLLVSSKMTSFTLLNFAF
jgi:hypothetical protein